MMSVRPGVWVWNPKSTNDKKQKSDEAKQSKYHSRDTSHNFLGRRGGLSLYLTRPLDSHRWTCY